MVVVDKHYISRVFVAGYGANADTILQAQLKFALSIGFSKTVFG